MTTEDRLRQLIADALLVEPYRLADDARFVDLQASTLDMALLAGRVEDAFCIEIDDDEMVKVQTVIDLIRLVERKSAEAGP